MAICFHLLQVLAQSEYTTSSVLTKGFRRDFLSKSQHIVS